MELLLLGQKYPRLQGIMLALDVNVMQVCGDLGAESEYEIKMDSNMIGQRDLLFITKRISDVFGHMGFTLCLVGFSILGGKTVAREMIFYSLMAFLTQGRITIWSLHQCPA